MFYSEKVKVFTAAHPCETLTVDGAQYRYILRGEGAKTLVFLNGGMNTLEMWMDYVDALSDGCRVLLFDYPQELRTNQALVAGMHAFFRRSALKTRSSSARVTAAWSRKFMCRNSPARPAG